MHEEKKFWKSNKISRNRKKEKQTKIYIGVRCGFVSRKLGAAGENLFILQNKNIRIPNREWQRTTMKGEN